MRLLKLPMKLLKKIVKYTFILVLFTALSHYTKIFYERAFYEYYGDAVVKLYFPQAGSGTGFNIRHKGANYILTNKHVCSMSPKGYLFSQGNSGIMLHKIIKTSKKHDLCLLEGLPRNNYISIASSYSFREKIFIIGHPRGDALTLEAGRIIGTKRIELPTIDDKKCSKKNERKDFFGRKFCVESLLSLQSNAIIFPGNSGSPVLNKWGSLIGVVFAGNRNVERMSFIVPLEYVKEFLEN